MGSVDEASIGLVDYSVVQNENGDAAFVRSLELANEIIGQGPIALKMIKKSINEGIEVPIEDTLDIEGTGYVQVQRKNTLSPDISKFNKARC